MRRVRLAVTMTLGLLTATTARADVAVEYIGHASFVLESPDGVRVVIDPFNSNRWLGYRYPDSVDADVVLVTHPHYDHDASYYFSSAAPVFREPGEIRFGDVHLIGVRGKHADPYGNDFGQKNTMWVIDTGGVRIAHLGDNGPLTETNIRELGRIDVLMVPADGDDHILKPHEIAAARRALDEPLVIPMHYRLEGFLDLPRSLGPIDPWLEGQSGVVRLDSNRTRLGPERVPGREVLVFQPSPELEPWPDALQRGWAKLNEARQLPLDRPEGLERAAMLAKQAVDLYPCIVFEFQWARAVAASGQNADAIAILESALARASHGDWHYRMSARSLLAELYAAEGRDAEARAQYRTVLQYSYRTELLEAAKAYLAEP